MTRETTELERPDPAGQGVPSEGRGSVLPKAVSGPDSALAERFRPLLRLDDREPYKPLAYGYSVLRASGPSPSSAHVITPAAALTIEYAIWYDWDIQHLFDLEHVWVHLDADERVVAVEASVHGKRVAMAGPDGLPILQGERPVLFVEAGKHAHWADGAAMAGQAGTRLTQQCSSAAGSEAVHRGNRFFQSGAYGTTPLADRLARLKMQRDGFVPSFAFSRSSDDSAPLLLPWPVLEAWIPARMKHLIAVLPQQVPHLAAVFLDCGDTLISEATEQKIPGTEVVLEAEEIPFAMEAVRSLHAKGFPLALVADGPRASFENLLKPRGIWDLMQAHVISQNVGELKPAPRMFETAMQALNLSEADRARVVMVGNNLERDIRGANAFGLLSLFVAWSKRRSHTPARPEDKPHHRIDSLDALVAMIEGIERSLPTRGSHG